MAQKAYVLGLLTNSRGGFIMKRSKKSTRILGLLATITVAITFVSMVTFLKNKVAVEAEPTEERVQ